MCCAVNVSKRYGIKEEHDGYQGKTPWTGGNQQSCWSCSWLNPTERSVYQNLWRFADPHGRGYICGTSAARFLEKCQLPTSVLFEIWKLCDPENSGQLHFPEFCLCCRLIAHAQQGFPVEPRLFNQEPKTIPKFNLTQLLHTTSSPAASCGSSSVFTSVDTSTPDAPLQDDPFLSRKHHLTPSEANGKTKMEFNYRPSSYTVTQKDMNKYKTIYAHLNLDEFGYLTGEEAKKIMLRSGLPHAVLSNIWTLVDQDADGRLNEMEFVIAMHLISISRYGVSVPITLPDELSVLLQRGHSQQDMETPAQPHTKTSSCVGHNEHSPVHYRSITRVSSNKPATTQGETEQRIDKVLTELCKMERYFLDHLVGALEKYGDQLESLKHIKSELTTDVKTEESRLSDRLNRCTEFKDQATKLKRELDQLLTQLRKVYEETSCVQVDIDHYQNDIIFLQRLIDITKKNTQQLKSKQQTIHQQIESTEDQSHNLHKDFKLIRKRVEVEREMLLKQQEEIRVLKKTFEAVQRDHKEAESSQAVLQEKLAKATLERNHLLQETNAEKSIIMNLQQLRLQAAEEKMKLTQTNPSPLLTTTPSIRMMVQTSGITPQASVPPNTCVRRDKKGVPADIFIRDPAQKCILHTQDTGQWTSELIQHDQASYDYQRQCGFQPFHSSHLPVDNAKKTLNDEFFVSTDCISRSRLSLNSPSIDPKKTVNTQVGSPLPQPFTQSSAYSTRDHPMIHKNFSLPLTPTGLQYKDFSELRSHVSRRETSNVELDMVDQKASDFSPRGIETGDPSLAPQLSPKRGFKSPVTPESLLSLDAQGRKALFQVKPTQDHLSL